MQYFLLTWVNKTKTHKGLFMACVFCCGVVLFCFVLKNPTVFQGPCGVDLSVDSHVILAFIVSSLSPDLTECDRS